MLSKPSISLSKLKMLLRRYQQALALMKTLISKKETMMEKEMQVVKIINGTVGLANR